MPVGRLQVSKAEGIRFRYRLVSVPSSEEIGEKTSEGLIPVVKASAIDSPFPCAQSSGILAPLGDGAGVEDTSDIDC